jgi:aldose 1-epimerase
VTLEVQVLPDLGGRLHRIIANGHDLLRNPPIVDTHRDEPFLWGSYPMIPWCNRIPNGRFSFGGREVQLPTQDGYAMHGEAYIEPWAEDGDMLIFHSKRWPWPYVATQHIAVHDDTLTLTLAITNEADEPMPAGAGIHPWFSNQVPLQVALPAELTYPTVDCLPVGEPVPVDGDLDRRVLGAVPWGLDTVWTGLTERTIELAWPAWDLHATFGFSATADHVVMAAFKDLNAVAIEPITHRPGAIPGILPPGERLSVVYTLTVGG